MVDQNKEVSIRFEDHFPVLTEVMAGFDKLTGVDEFVKFYSDSNNEQHLRK